MLIVTFCPIAAVVLLLFTNTLTTPSPANCFPLAPPLAEDTAAATRIDTRSISLSALTVTSPPALTLALSPRPAFTTVLFTTVLIPTPALLFPP